MMIDKDFEDVTLIDFLEAYEEDLEEGHEEDLEEGHEEDLEEDLQEDLEQGIQTFQIYNTYSLQSSDSFLDSALDDLSFSDVSFLLIFSFCVFLFINFWCGGVKNV